MWLFIHMDVYVRKTIVAYAGLLISLICMVGYPVRLSAQATPLLTAERRQALEAELKELESQIGTQRQILDSKRQESASLERDIAILDANIREAKLAIKARDLSIQRLSADIGDKQEIITELTRKIDREKESLSQLLRKTNEIDSYSIAEFALSNVTLSDFFQDLDSFESIQRELYASFEYIGREQAETIDQKTALEEKRAEQLELRHLQELQKVAIERQETEKKNLLKSTKGQEKVYQQILASTEKNAAAIRTALFSLSGTGAIPFEKAYQLATEAGRATGLRPAFILGIIAEESNLGQNVGTGNWKTDMHPTRDQPVFERIAAKLGLDPNALPVSKKAWYGWGGAMGPAQFIPSTWVIYEDKVAALVGHNPVNPWEPRDAFFASAVLLKDNGGARGGRDAERLAALRYLAGWKNATKPAYAFYGNEVMDLADKYQRQIDILTGK